MSKVSHFKSILVLSFLAFTASLGYSQEESPLLEGLDDRNQLEISYRILFPSTPWSAKQPNTSLGWNFAYFRKIRPDKPLWLGVNLGTTTYDRQGYFLNTFIDFDFVSYSLITHLRVHHAHLCLEWMPERDWLFLPYAKAGMGLLNLVTKTQLDGPPEIWSTLIPQDILFESDWSLSEMVEAGTQIRLLQRNVRLDLVLGIGYHIGAAADYYVRNKNEFLGTRPADNFEPVNSRINTIHTHAGVRMRF
jgi:hypothetical protein